MNNSKVKVDRACADHCEHDLRWMQRTQDGLQCVKIVSSNEICGHRCFPEDGRVCVGGSDGSASCGHDYEYSHIYADKPNPCSKIIRVREVTEAQRAALHQEFQDDAGVERCGHRCVFPDTEQVERHKYQPADYLAGASECGYKDCTEPMNAPIHVPAEPPPLDYRCSKCKAQGVKLWRQYQTFLEHVELLCFTCGLTDQGKSEAETRNTDTIGWLVPAVPTNDGTFWGYTSVPQERVDWWERLPKRAAGTASPLTDPPTDADYAELFQQLTCNDEWHAFPPVGECPDCGMTETVSPAPQTDSVIYELRAMFPESRAGELSLTCEVTKDGERWWIHTPKGSACGTLDEAMQIIRSK